MPPSAAGSAHLDASKLTSGMAPALKSKDNFVTGEMATTQRSINPDAEASSGQVSFSRHLDTDAFVEVSKRRRVEHESSLQRPSQQPLARASFGSDSIKALFDSELPATTSGQVQPNRNASMLVSSMATSAGPGVSRNISGLLGPGGSVHHTDPRNTLSALTGITNNTGKRDALDSVGFLGSVPRGINVPGAPFTSQPTGFVIPGLGALPKPLGLDNSKKTFVSSPVKTRAIVPESQPRNGGVAPDISDLRQQTASDSVNTSASQMQSDGGAVRPPTDLQSSPSKQESSVLDINAAADQIEEPMMQDPTSSAVPATPKKSQVTTSPSGTTKDSDYVRPSGTPPVWIEKQAVRTFKLLRAQNNHRSFQTFDGAYTILSGMNPDHYSMPHGSQVVAIKCPNLDDILMSLQTGFWATNQNVMTRIMDLHNSREDPSMKTLFLWSMPGSKHFCGLSELQAFNPKAKTDFWDKETGKWIKVQGSMMLQWKYCKLVPYDEVIPLVEGKIDQGSITQMWNGMYYTEATGREVVKAYIEAPHIENLLAAPTTEFFRRAMENSKIATVPPMGPKFFGRGGYRGRGGYKSSRRGTFENGKTDTRTQPSSAPGSAIKQEPKEADCSTQTNATSPEHIRDRGKPEVQILPVLMYADGTMTTAPDMNGKTVPVTRAEGLVDIQTSRAERTNSLTQAPAQSYRAARSDSLVSAQSVHVTQRSRDDTLGSLAQTQGSRAEKPNSMTQTQSGHTMQSSNALAAMQSSNMLAATHTPATLDTSIPISQRKSGSIFDEAVNGNSFEMAPPPKPSATQLACSSHSEHHSFSTPRTMPSSRFSSNVDTWSYTGCLTPPRAVQPNTPVSQSRSLYGLSTSPMETSPYATPTTHGVRLPSTPSRVGSEGKITYGFGQVPEKLRTPDSSPLAARIQLAEQADTPRPVFGRGHGDQVQGEDMHHPHWVSMLVDHE